MSHAIVWTAFISPALPFQSSRDDCRHGMICSVHRTEGVKQFSRRSVLLTISGLIVNPKLVEVEPAVADERESKDAPALTGFQSRSGLKYFDFSSGDGPTPKWGDFINIQYVAYTISPSGESLVQQDSSYDLGRDGYLVHHGNGQLILGLEEALHSMSVGGRRRAIIPRNLAYFKSDLGPVPSRDSSRRKFSRALSQGDGTVVFDIEVLKIYKDPDDRGYYNDLTPTEDEVRALMME